MSILILLMAMSVVHMYIGAFTIKLGNEFNSLSLIPCGLLAIVSGVGLFINCLVELCEMV